MVLRVQQKEGVCKKRRVCVCILNGACDKGVCVYVTKTVCVTVSGVCNQKGGVCNQKEGLCV